MMLSEIKNSRADLVHAVTGCDWPPSSDEVEMLATITDYIRREDPEWSSAESIGYRVHLDGCAWSNGVILGFDFDDPHDNQYHVHSFNTGEVETYELGKNMELANVNVLFHNA